MAWPSVYATMDLVYVDRAIQTEDPHPLADVPDVAPDAQLNHYVPDDITADMTSVFTEPKPRRLTPRKPYSFSYNRPSGSFSSTSRFSSLPGPSLPIIHETSRVASMPEYQLLPSDLSAENSNSSEYFDSHSSYDSSRLLAGSMHSRIQLSQSILPQTPSPPSSPESIMIIGNNVQVTQSFLRNKHEARPQTPVNVNEGMLTSAAKSTSS